MENMIDKILSVQIVKNSVEDIIETKDCTFISYVPLQGLWYRLNPEVYPIPIIETDIFVPFTSILRISFIKNTFT